MQTDFKLSYFLEDLNRLNEISVSQLDTLAENFPAVANIHFLRAKKYQLEGRTDELPVFERVSFHVFDKAQLYQRMTQSELEENKDIQIAPLEPEEVIVEDQASFESELEQSIAILKAIESQELLEETIDDNTELIETKEESTIQDDQIHLAFVENNMIQKIPGKIQNVYELDEEELKSLSPFSRWLLNLNPDANLADLNSGEKHEYSGPEKEIDSPSTEPLREDEPGILKKKKKKKKKSREKEGDTWKEHTEKKKKKKKKKSKDISIKQRAKRSLELSQELVTEPLAELLASQGHKEEAIVMFTKLSLIFPKKSSYFADRINRLKNN